MSDSALLTAAASLDVPLLRLTSQLAGLVDGACAGARCRLFVSDHRHEYLVPALADAPDVRIGRSPPGECYTQQLPVVDGDAGDVSLWLPVSTHGDRIGVLQVVLPERRMVSDSEAAALSALAGIVARTLRAGIGVTDDLLVTRRSRSLSVAAEMQWALLPGNSYADERVAVAGQLEPGNGGGADAYDWCRSAEDLVVAVFDGIEARPREAVVRTALAVGAFRNARRFSHDLAHVVRLTDQAIHDESRGNWWVPATFVRLDFAAGTAEAIGAGSPLVLRCRGGGVRRLALSDQLPLGMFEATAYEAETVDAVPGDRLLIVTDGAQRDPAGDQVGGAVTGWLPDEGDAAVLARAVRATAGQPVWELARHVIDAVRRRHADRLDDDVVAVALDVA